MQEVTLEGMPPVKKKRVIRKKKFQPTKNVPVEVSVRRQVSEEIGEDEPLKDEKFILLQKFGVTAPRIDRLVTKPNWMGVSEWKRKQNEWLKATKGLVNPSQRSRNFRPQRNSQQPLSTQRSESTPRGATTSPTSKPGHRPWREIRHKNPNHRRTDSHRNSSPTRTETPRS